MKNLIKTLTVSSVLLVSSIAAAQTEKFERQSLWTDARMVSVEQDFTFSGFKTDRNTWRISPRLVDYKTEFVMDIHAEGKNLSGWRNLCSRGYVKDRFKDIKSISLSLKGNPWAKEAYYTVKATDELMDYVTWDKIENMPKNLSFKLKVEENRGGVSIVPHVMGYETYVWSIEQTLNAQLEKQMSEFLKTGRITLDLNDNYQKVFACDMTVGLAEIYIEVEMEAEPESAHFVHWISSEKFSDLYNELNALPSRNVEVSSLQAGLMLGMGIAKVQPEMDVLNSDRDKKLFKALFADKSEEGNEKFILKNFFGPGLKRAFADLPEVSLLSIRPQKLSNDVEMANLRIQVGE